MEEKDYNVEIYLDEIVDEIEAGISEAEAKEDNDTDMLSEDLSGLDTFDYSSVTEPHWLFDRSTLLKSILFMNTAVKNANNFLLKVVKIKYNDGFVEFTVNTGEIQTFVKVPVINNDNHLSKEYFVSFNSFYLLVRNAGENILFRDRDNCLCVNVLDGEVEVESYNIDNDIFNFNFTVIDESEPLLCNELTRILKRAIASMALAQQPEQNRICFDDGRAYSNYMYAFTVQSYESKNPFALRTQDAIILSQMLSDTAAFTWGKKDGAKKGFIFKTVNAMLVIPEIDLKGLQGLYKHVESFNEELAWFNVPALSFYRVVTLVKELLDGAGNVNLLAKDGMLTLSAVCRSGRLSKFNLAKIPESLNFNTSFQVVALVKVLNLFRDSAHVQIAVKDMTMMTVKSEDMWVALAGMMVKE